MKTTQHVKLIGNPVSGKHALKKIYHIRQLLEGYGADVDLFLTQAAGDAEREAAGAREQGFDRIIAAGGDGTLNEVVNGLAPCETPLAFIPLGTTNVFALEAGISFSLESACRTALAGQARQVTLGRAGGRFFLLMAGIGFDAEVVHRVSSPIKRRLGKAAYLWSALKVLGAPVDRPLRVELPDGSTHSGYAAVVGNSRYYAGRFIMTPGASLFDKELEVCILHRPGRFNLVRALPRVLLRRRLPETLALVLRAPRLRITGDSLPVQIDGDAFGTLPLDFSAESGMLRIVFPEKES